MKKYMVTGKWPIYIKSENRTVTEKGEVIELDPEVSDIDRLVELGAIELPDAEGQLVTVSDTGTGEDTIKEK